MNKRYRILSVLGQGGMGAVYHAIDQNLGVAVAVKENLFLSDEYARQFQREASILANLRHPNLPRVGDYFIIPGQGQYLIMDYIEGEDLRERIERSNTLPEREVALIGAAICDALTYLHNRRPQIIHRDIKPGNIKITPSGEILLVDFGLAKVIQGPNQATTSGARAMTPGYSPPEQYGTAPTDPRSDIYSLGATLYAALTSSIPEDALARATGKAKLTGVRDFSPKTNRRIAVVIEKALEIEPENRYQTAEDMKKALLQAASISRNPEEKIFITPPPAPYPGQPVNANSAPIVRLDSSIDASPIPKPNIRRRSFLSWVLLPVIAMAVIVMLALARPSLIPKPVAAFLFRTNTPAYTQEIQPTAASTQEQTALITEGSTATATSTLPTATQLAPIVSTTEQVETPVQPVPTLSPTAFGGGFAEIAYSSDRSGTTQIWLMNYDGSNQHELTDLPDGACLPAWSPDGKTLAFISPCVGKREMYEGAKIYLWDLDPNTAPTPLPLPASPAGDFYPTWSPDGRQIAFTSLRGPKAQILVYNIDTQLVDTLTDGRYADIQPVFSPDGSQIAFIRKFTYTEVWVMGRKGENAHRLSPPVEVNHYYPVWTPDSQFLFVSQSKNGDYIPWLTGFRVENGEVTSQVRVPAKGLPEIGPVSGVSISPDGAWIVFEGWPDGSNHDIYSITINGANRQRLTNHKTEDFSPAWRPG